VVRGLEIFQKWFAGFENQYVLIGGSAAVITMAEAGVPFRGTKDLDIVLHVEVLTQAFGLKFWEFVQAGGYQRNEGNPQEKPCLYRFQKPLDIDFPHTLELFARVPDKLDFIPPGHLTPIPVDEQVSSLSAILLDDVYYQFVLSGRHHRHGMPSWVGEDRLIPLKALAWMEMNERVRQGAVIKAKEINKHLDDVVQLSALLRPGQMIELPEKLRTDLRLFVQAVIQLNQPLKTQAMQRVAEAYGLL